LGKNGKNHFLEGCFRFFPFCHKSMEKKRTPLLYLALLLVWALPLGAQTLQSALDAFDNHPGLLSGQWGFYAVDVANKRVVGQRNADKSLLPASTLKVLTTATGLGGLGGDYRFRTELRISGAVVAGVLHGNVHIVGYGDPTLGSADMPGASSMKDLFTAFARALQQTGIRSIKGKVVGENGWNESDSAPAGWQWADLGNFYAAGASGLNIHENRYKAVFQPSQKAGGTPRLLRLDPEVPGFSLINELVGGDDEKDDAYIYAAPFSPQGYVRGKIPSGKSEFTLKGSLPDPALFAAHHLRKFLAANGIPVTGAAVTERLDKELPATRALYTHRSPSLRKIVERANFESVNLYCEAILKALCAHQGVKVSYVGGAAAVKKFWEDRGLSFEGVFQDDGSGLSRSNAVTAKFLGELLRKIHADPQAFGDFSNTLPVAGQSGTVKIFCQGTPAEGRVRTKSGSMTRVRGFTGYATARSGKTIAFCLIANQFSCTDKEIRTAMEGIMTALVAQ
jgi:D-alanyl-D-alanine carboxypeptidase/D-alanyl-D-alanine-endopeptidase (penicillin-binding protein 4)